jgi:hypothetical protein
MVKETTLIQGITKILKSHSLGPVHILEDRFYRKLRKIAMLSLRIKCRKYKSKRLSALVKFKMSLNS